MQLSPADLAFRDEVRAFLAANLTPELRRAGERMTSVYADHEAQMAWQAKLHAKGWAAPAWPVEYGGCDWSVVQHYIFAAERVRAGAPPVSPMGIKMCVPAIIGFGTDEQKAHCLPRMLNGEHFWCQGYSEPGADSDLASLQMSAVRDGDDLVCTGTKIWTTHANVANVLGAIDDGWTVAKYLLEFERGGSAYAPEIEVALQQLARDVAALPLTPSRTLLEVRIAEARIRCDVPARLESDILSQLSAGQSIGADASMMKILGAELQQHVTELALEAAGPLARAFQPGVTMPGGPIPGLAPSDYCSGAVWQAIAPLHYLNERASSIYAGTNEIQRGILAKAELGL